MRVNRCAPTRLVVGVALVAVAGCGGSSDVSPNAPQEAAVSTPQSTQSTAPHRPLTTPQGAARSYLEGVQAINGAAICNVLDTGLQRTIIQEVVRVRPLEAGASCAQAVSVVAATATSPNERRAKLPRLHVSRTGDRAVVSYVGARTHKRRFLVLVKHGSGWLIDQINGKG
jgi:hypothetical protein